jgi:hypothetical protein
MFSLFFILFICYPKKCVLRSTWWGEVGGGLQNIYIVKNYEKSITISVPIFGQGPLFVFSHNCVTKTKWGTSRNSAHA